MFSRTLRKYGALGCPCAGDEWSYDEAKAADELLAGLRVVAQLRRAELQGSGLLVDEDTYLWTGGEPDFDKLLADEVERLAGTDVARVAFLTAVAQRLRGELHMPAVRATLGCLIPEELHPRLDKSKARRSKGAGAERVGVHLEADRWRVDVSEEASLGVPGRPVAVGVLEFFL